MLYDDNTSKASSKYLEQLADKHKSINVLKNWLQDSTDYKNHAWQIAQVDRIITIKNKAISYALENNYDYLFLIDADLVLHPNTLIHLQSLDKDFVFELFWTVFTDQTYAKPNCWDKHSWHYERPETILQLKTPGTYPINAGGACTLLAKNAMEKGLNFSRIASLPYGGEDRHFCTRAEVLGIDIFIDTHYPAYHIFKETMVKEASQWVKNGCQPGFFNNWLDEHWEQCVKKSFTEISEQEPKTKLERLKFALYKAKRAYINYMRYH